MTENTERDLAGTVPLPSKADRTLTLDGYDQLLGRFLRMSFLMVVLEQGLLLVLMPNPGWLRLMRLAVAAAALAAYVQTPRGIPSLKVRWWMGAAFGLWMVAGPALMSRDVHWPFGLEIIPVGASVLALAATWELALGILGCAILLMTGMFVSGAAPVPPMLPQLAGNWFVLAAGLMIVVRQLLRSFDGASAELEASVASLETARREAAALADRLAREVQDALSTVQESLAAGPVAVETAAHRMLALLHEGRRLKPAEPTLPDDDFAGSLRQMRASLTRAVLWVGSLVLCLQVIRNGMAGRTAIVGLNVAYLLLFAGYAAFHVRLLARWPWSIQIIAGGSTLLSILHLSAWRDLDVALMVLPPVSMGLIVPVLLGAISGMGRLPVIWSGVFGAGAVMVLGTDAWPTLLLCVVYAAFGVLLASLQEALLEAVAVRRKEATGAIRYRRRLIGTLFHDLANPLQAVAILVSPEGPHGGATVPTEATTLVRRMRGTLEAALGRVQPPERVPLNELFEALLTVFGARLATKRITLVPDWEPDMAVRANRSLLQDTVLANLLSNAIKFSPAGSTIRVQADRAGAMVRITIHDRGPGIPESALAALEAGRVAPSQDGTAGERGSGHGLLLTRDYLEEMGGQLLFERPTDGGVLAIVVLPAA